MIIKDNQIILGQDDKEALAAISRNAEALDPIEAVRVIFSLNAAANLYVGYLNLTEQAEGVEPEDRNAIRNYMLETRFSIINRARRLTSHLAALNLDLIGEVLGIESEAYLKEV